MLRKISLILAFLICSSASVAVFPRAEHSHPEENHGSNLRVASLSTGRAAGNSELTMDSDYVQTATMNSDYSEWLLGAPDEIISASTTELLEYFLKSPFMGQRIYSCSSVPDYNEIDFSCHKAFRELISREDCIDTLENYAGNILRGAESAESDKIGFGKLLTQPSVKTLMDDLADTAADYPNLRNMYIASEVVPS